MAVENWITRPSPMNHGGAGYVLFSKTGHREKVKPAKAVRDLDCSQV
jgi:hypothetical protein